MSQKFGNYWVFTLPGSSPDSGGLSNNGPKGEQTNPDQFQLDHSHFGKSLKTIQHPEFLGL